MNFMTARDFVVIIGIIVIVFFTLLAIITS